MKKIFIKLFACFLFVSCYSEFGSRSKSEPFFVEHKYILSVKDVNGNPMEGVSIKYIAVDYTGSTPIRGDSILTGNSGTLSVIVPINRYPDNIYFITNNCKTEIKYWINKKGYYPINGELVSGKGNVYPDSATYEKDIMLIQPLDYLNSDFLLSPYSNELKSDLLTIIKIVKEGDYIPDFHMGFQSIQLKEFKSVMYLYVKLYSNNVYNLVRLNKYDIAKTFFDEVVKKWLKLIDTYETLKIKGYGYDINIIGYAKSFVNETEEVESIDYRFLIPYLVAEQYLYMEISSQQLLDSSIVLMDEGRIELKFQ